MPEKEADPKTMYQLIKDELMLDGNSRQNLATFCQTFVDEEIHQLMDDCIDKNMIDKDEYPQTAEIETYEDHRMAMSIAPCAMKHPQIKILHSEVVNKSYPTFWEDLQRVGVILQ